MQPPTTPPVTQPAAPVAGAPAIQPGQGGLAIAAFVCGLGGIFTSWCCIGLPLAIAAVVCGILGKKDAEKRGASNWMWTTGLILGIISLVIFAIVVIARPVASAAIRPRTAHADMSTARSRTTTGS